MTHRKCQSFSNTSWGYRMVRYLRVFTFVFHRFDRLYTILYPVLSPGSYIQIQVLAYFRSPFTISRFWGSPYIEFSQSTNFCPSAWKLSTFHDSSRFPLLHLGFNGPLLMLLSVFHPSRFILSPPLPVLLNCFLPVISFPILAHATDINRVSLSLVSKISEFLYPQSTKTKSSQIP